LAEVVITIAEREKYLEERESFELTVLCGLTRLTKRRKRKKLRDGHRKSDIARDGDGPYRRPGKA